MFYSNHVKLLDGTYDELLRTMYAYSYEYDAALVAVSYKYTHEPQYQHSIEPCSIDEYDTLSWFNDWDECQQCIIYEEVLFVRYGG